MNSTPTESFPETPIATKQWTAQTFEQRWRAVVAPRPPLRQLALACGLLLLTFATCLAAGTQFAVSYAHNSAVSFDEFVRSVELLYKNPAALVAGLPFALTLLAILLAHELGHFYACRYYRIRSTYPFFIPAPTLIGTFGAFILIRSPIWSRRALFDVGASGPIAGFVVALPALAFGAWKAKVVADLTMNADVVFGVPLALRWFLQLFHPGVGAAHLLLHPVGRAAWVGLFATALNLLPAGQLDGGHILRTVSPRIHRIVTIALPMLLVVLGLLLWWVWLVWAVILFGLRFLRAAPVYDNEPLDARRKWLALLSLAIFVLCFMPAPILNP